MTRTEELTVTRVVSRDGTEIAYWTSGDGPPLVLVHGTTADHTRWAPVLKYLEPHVTVHTMDRRGRGGSGDTTEYDVVREFEDVAVVVDAVAETSGSAVDLLGHSFGGFCAFGAATLTSKIHKLVLYEGWPAPNPAALAIPRALQERMDALLAEGEHERALEAFFREIVRMPDHEFERYHALPAWQARIAAAHTITREDQGEPFDPEEAKKITVPVLLMVGGDSPPAMQADYETVAAALPDARVTVMDGQQHIAIDLIPEEFARRVLTFLR
jgi:pimeloyl-ACP methyl ester carboxylesterase